MSSDSLATDTAHSTPIEPVTKADTGADADTTVPSTAAASSTASAAASSSSASTPTPSPCSVCSIPSLHSCSRCLLTRYCSRAHQLSHWSLHKLECGVKCDVRRSEAGEGMGLWMRRRVEEGERIIEETPLLLLPSFSSSSPSSLHAATTLLTAQFVAMREEDRERVLAFTDKQAVKSEFDEEGAKPSPTLIGICMTNQLPCSPSTGESGIFLRICRSNHSCRPNAEYSWSDSLKKQVLHAIRPIEKDEEILVSYMSSAPFLTYEERRSRLLHGFKFDCACRLCEELARDAEEREKSDERRERLAQIQDELMSPLAAHSPDAAIASFSDFVSLYASEHHTSSSSQLGRMYFRAFQIAVCHTRLQKEASEYVRKAVDIYTKCKGSVVSSYQPYIDAPQSHPDAGVLDQEGGMTSEERDALTSSSTTSATAASSSSSSSDSSNRKKKSKKTKK